MALVEWQVEGMDCSNCALTVTKYLEGQGMQQVKVNPITGEVSFVAPAETTTNHLPKGIANLGYEVVFEEEKGQSATAKKSILSTYQSRFFFALPFALLLLLHMFVDWHWLHNGYAQLLLSLPVYLLGLKVFGKSAYGSLKLGRPNMNVLIVLGATAAFVYSLLLLLLEGTYSKFYFETTTTIITLVFLGHWLEEWSVNKTQVLLQQLVKAQPSTATMIAFDDQYQEQLFTVDRTHLRIGDLLLVKEGEQVPTDAKILWGELTVSEALLSGESTPIHKQGKDQLLGGSLVLSGTAKVTVTAVGKDTVLSNIVDLVKRAQGDKPPMQLLADKISAWFVPIVVSIAVISFGINYWFAANTLTESLMRSIAILVIACPCAMGLATPAAIAVGLGRGARNGMLFRNATSLENFKHIQQVVFDKTGTLTTGDFTIANFTILENEINDSEFKRIAYSLEKFSNHPIAKAISKQWLHKQPIRFAQVKEEKGKGMWALDEEGNEWRAGSAAYLSTPSSSDNHAVYLLKNQQVIGWIDVIDEVRPEAAAVIQTLTTAGIQTVLLSGDRQVKCEQLAATLGIRKVYAEKSPEQKLAIIEELNQLMPTAMVGDGINDAPALAKATVGISLSDASQLAMQTAQVVLLHHGIAQLPAALNLGKYTYNTITSNLWWAFSYNLIAIPIAAVGGLSPALAALAMGFSDVVLALNSLRLLVKKI